MKRQGGEERRIPRRRAAQPTYMPVCRHFHAEAVYHLKHISAACHFSPSSPTFAMPPSVAMMLQTRCLRLRALRAAFQQLRCRLQKGDRTPRSLHGQQTARRYAAPHTADDARSLTQRNRVLANFRAFHLAVFFHAIQMYDAQLGILASR